MKIFLPFIMAVAPALFLLRYFYIKDSKKPEPINLIIEVFSYGVISIFPILVLEYIATIISSFLSWTPLMFYFLEAFFVAGFCEEWIKQQIITIYVYDNKHFDELMDGIIYTIVAGLGFACMENVMYVYQYGYQTAFLRAFTSVPFHASCSGVMGYYIGKAKFSDNDKDKKFYLNKGLIIAVVLHGLYDFVLMAAPVIGHIYSAFIIPFVMIVFKYLNGKIRESVAEDVEKGRVV